MYGEVKQIVITYKVTRRNRGLDGGGPWAGIADCSSKESVEKRASGNDVLS